MKKYIEPSILLLKVLHQEPVLAGSLPSEDEEGYGDAMGNMNGYVEDDENQDRRNRRGGNAVWDDFEEEEDY